MRLACAVSLVVLALFLVLGEAADSNIAVNVNANRRTINQQIYGVNFFASCDDGYGCTKPFNPTDLGFSYPVNRWGGDSVTTYAYDINKDASGADWYFVSATSSQRSNFTKQIDQFIWDSKQINSEPFIEISMIGWLPKTTNPDKCWGSSIIKYGPQDGHESYSTDAGNGKRGNVFLPNLTPRVLLDPTDCSRAVTENYTTSQIQYFQSKYGTAAAGGVKYYALDNEIALWSSTHIDIHPTNVTYDEMWNKSLTFSKAIRAAEPNAIIFSPPAWGWCEYFYSAADGCSPGADRAAHGNVDLLQWFVLKAYAYYNTTGFKVFDYLDLHFYPQAGEYSTDESPAMQKTRLETTRSLYDLNYKDPSWIGTDLNSAIYLIPRMKAIINMTGDPNFVKFSISEYNWGDGTISSAIAQAEVLAILGREGVDLATRWAVPPRGSCVEAAFKLYLNYDGAGSIVSGDSISSVLTSGASNNITTYGIVNSNTGQIYVLVFNKDPNIVSHSVAVDVGQNISGQVSVYSITPSNCTEIQKSTATAAASSFTSTVVGYSANLFVLSYASSGSSGTTTGTNPGTTTGTNSETTTGTTSGSTNGTDSELDNINTSAGNKLQSSFWRT